MEQTLSIIKPEAVEKKQIGNILARFEKEGFRIVAAKMMHLTKEQAEKFYDIHKDKPFFHDLVIFMTSGPILVQVLEGKDIVERNRELMGATNPKEAKPNTIRADFGTNIEKNAVHGSDSIENAKREITFFFSKDEIFACKCKSCCC